MIFKWGNLSLSERLELTGMNVTLINLEILVLNTEAKFQGRTIRSQLSQLFQDLGEKIYTILIITPDGRY